MILNWPRTYKEKLTDAQSALSKIRRGARIFIGSACGVPQLLVKTLIDVRKNLADVEIIHFLDIGLTSCIDKKYDQYFRHNALFIGSNMRAAIKEGRADYTPIFLSEIPLLMERGSMPIDVALITVSTFWISVSPPVSIRSMINTFATTRCLSARTCVPQSRKAGRTIHQSSFRKSLCSWKEAACLLMSP